MLRYMPDRSLLGEEWWAGVEENRTASSLTPDPATHIVEKMENTFQVQDTFSEETLDSLSLLLHPQQLG